MSNAYQKFLKLLPSDPMQVGTVTAHNLDGTSDIELPGAQVIRVRGQGVAPGSKAFIRSGEIQGAAPNLPVFTIEI